MTDTNEITSKWHLAGVILAGAMALFMVNLDSTVVNIVLPELCEKFAIDTAEASLIVMAYLLALTGTALMFGRLSDMKGPERIFIGGYVVFSIGSGLCAMAWDLWSLAAFRFIQGIGGAMIFATSAVMVMRYVPAEVRGRAYAINGMMAGVGFAMGSPVGGFLAHHFSWQAVFLVNIPIGLLGIFFCVKFLTRRDRQQSNSTFDIPGSLASFAALIILVLSLHSFSDTTRFSPAVTSGFIIAIALLLIFLYVEKNATCPLVPLTIFKNRYLNFALAGTATYYVILQGTAIVFPFYFIHARGMTEIETGNLLFAGPMMTIILGPVVGWLCDKIGPKTPCLGGALLFIVSALLFLSFDQTTPSTVLLLTIILFGVAMTFYAAPILTLTMSHAEPETLGVLSSLKAVLPSIIGMIGVACFATVYNHGSQSTPAQIATASQAGFHSTMYLALAVALACLVCTIFTRGKQ